MSYKEIDIDAYNEQFANNNDYQLIDVREVDEYEEGRLPGAVNIPLSEFQVRYDEISEDQTVVLVCARGGRSAKASDFLIANGYEDVYNLDGGTLGWMSQGNPVEK